MNKRKMLSRTTLALALTAIVPIASAQYIPLTDLPEVPIQMDEAGRLIQPDNAHIMSTSDALGHRPSDNLNSSQMRSLSGEAQRSAPYGHVQATPIAPVVDDIVPQGGAMPPSVQPRLLNEEPAEGGWEGLARLLKKLEPSVDTSLPETRTQLSNRLNNLINAGHHQAALNEIAKVFSSIGYIESPGEDVQLRFLQSRAYAGLGQAQRALESYKDLISKYPELPEPYNNLAVLQMNLGSIDEAYEALMMATAIRPSYGIAQRNLGIIHLIKAEESFQVAAQQRVQGAAPTSQAIRNILQGQVSK